MNRRQMLMWMGLVPVAATAVPVVEFLSSRRQPAKVRTRTGFRGEYFPNVTLRDQDGRKVRLYEDLLHGKNVLINFFYANCKDGVCPVTTENLKKFQELLGARCGREVHMYSFSLSPETDTPARLKHYQEMHETGPGWTFLTGSPRDMELCRQRFGFVDPDPELDRRKNQHTNVVLMGNEPQQRWMASPAMTNPDFLLHQMNRVIGLPADHRG